MFIKGVIDINKKIKKETKCKYIYSEKFKTNKENVTEKELKDIFNRKFFKTIIKIEKSSFEGL